jgi:Tol biopolymer transport system component
MPKHLFAFIFLLLFFSQSFAQLEVPPHIHWKKLTTPHFEVIYNAEQQDLGLLYATKLEQAYSLLRSYFSEAPSRTVVVINDKLDLANGYATRIPYPHIMIYPVMPGPQEGLADSGDWAFELLAHEYTHILTFEPAHGFMRGLRAIFGNIVAPNMLLPRWWTEGVAVDMETRLAGHGRLRSIFQDAAIRSWTLDGQLLNFTLAEINENIPSWPRGNRPYLFGSLMWSQMIADQGEEVINGLHQKHSSRVPYFLDAPAQDLLKKSYMAQYEATLTTTYKMAQEQMQSMRKQEPTEYIQPNNKDVTITAPTISPNGQHLALITEDDTNSRSVKIITRKNLKESFLRVKSATTAEDFAETQATELQNDGPVSGTIQRISWMPDSSGFVYDKVDLTNRIQRFSDLHLWDTQKRKSRTLTQGLRAREPAVSIDGKNIVFVRLSGGETSLSVLSLSEGNQSVQNIFTPALQERVSYPSYLDNKTIVFSLRKANGEENLHVINLETLKVEKILPEYPNARFARLTKKGLMFTSSRNGTHNIYLADANLATARPLTHTLTATFAFDLDASTGELFSTLMTSRGLKMVAYEEKAYQKTVGPLPEIKPLFADRYPTQDSPPETEPVDTNNFEVSEYSAGSYLWPQYWMPFIAGTSSETGIIVQAQTSGFDPLKKHQYTLVGSWDTGINKGGVLGTYLNHTTVLPVLVSSYSRTSYLGNAANEFQDFSGALAVLPDMFWLSKYAGLQVGWQYFQRSTEFSTIKRTGPQATLTYRNYTQSGDQVSPESGWGGYLGANHYVPSEGYVAHNQFKLGATLYLSRFLKQRHALMIKMNSIYTPETVPALFGVTTAPLMFTPDNPLPEYVMRGYRNGQFLGKNVVNTNIEYRFPLQDIYGGYGTDPLFIRRLNGALIADGIVADGFYANRKKGLYEAINMKTQYWTLGTELKLDLTLGYAFPVTFVLGYYAALNAESGIEGTLGTTLQIAGF